MHDMEEENVCDRVHTLARRRTELLSERRRSRFLSETTTKKTKPPSFMSASDHEQPLADQLEYNAIQESNHEHVWSWTALSNVGKSIAVVILMANIVGQAMENITLPLALSTDVIACVLLCAMCLTYFMFFALLDVMLDAILAYMPHLKDHVQQANKECARLDDREVVRVGGHNGFNGIGTVFGALSSRLPLPLQMSVSLLVNLAAPLYKMWLLGIPWSAMVRTKALQPYLVATSLYTTAFVLTLVDKMMHVESQSLGWPSLLFVIGAWYGMTYNIHEEKLMRPLHMESNTEHWLVSFKKSVHVLRKQLSWLFLFSWLGVILAIVIPGFDPNGYSTAAFYESWGVLLRLNNVYMNLFNLGYIVCFITSIYLNKFDSSFNMLVSNVSAVLSLWTGWMPSIAVQTVGYKPSYVTTILAMLCSLAAIYPSLLYSQRLRPTFKSHLERDGKSLLDATVSDEVGSAEGTTSRTDNSRV